ncbi:MAG: cyclic nucleotide-binding/CBS domain-containing protein [Phycisphaerae bacterium]
MATVSDIDRIAGEDRQVLTIRDSAVITEAAKKMGRHHVGCLLAVDAEGRLTGIFTERDILSKVVAPGLDPEKTPVSKIMTPRVVSCSRKTSVNKAEQMMAHYSVRHLPIVDNGVPVGMVSSRDIHSHKLAFTEMLARQQYAVLNRLESEYPGITNLHCDETGKVVI